MDLSFNLSDAEECREVIRLMLTHHTDSLVEGIFDIKPQPIQPKKYYEYHTDLQEWEISSRTLNCFRNAGIRTVDDLTELSIARLRALPSFGDRSLNELLDMMDSYGLKFKGDIR